MFNHITRVFKKPSSLENEPCIKDIQEFTCRRITAKFKTNLEYIASSMSASSIIARTD